MKKYCVLLASGTGSRFGSDCPKQFLRLGDKMVIEHTLTASDCGLFDEIIVVVSEPYLDFMKETLRRRIYHVGVRVVVGGTSRKESCENAIKTITDADAYVIIHNGVQPFVSVDEFVQCLAALKKYPAVTNGSPCVYTVLETDNDGVIVNMPNRAHCFNDLGPECFQLNIIRKVLVLLKNETTFTNFTAAVMKYGLGSVYVNKGNPRNMKITYPQDLKMAEQLLHEV